MVQPSTSLKATSLKATSLKAIFIDRDGTLIQDMHYLKDPSLVQLIPGAGAALKKMRQCGFTLFVVSNQSGVNQGIISDQQFYDVHQRFCELLMLENVEIAEFLYCFHSHDEKCQCRKPKPGLIPKAHAGRPIDWTVSYVVGDRRSDIELAHNIGARAYLVLTGKGKDTLEELHDEPVSQFMHVVRDLEEMATHLSPK